MALLIPHYNTAVDLLEGVEPQRRVSRRVGGTPAVEGRAVGAGALGGPLNTKEYAGH